MTYYIPKNRKLNKLASGSSPVKIGQLGKKLRVKNRQKWPIFALEQP